MDTIHIEPVTPERWDALAKLFGSNGACSGCWCTFLRQSAKSFEANCPNGGKANRRLLKQVVDSGATPGLLAIRDTTPVGWVALAPRGEYPRVLRSPVHKPIDNEAGVWSITCFFVDKRERGSGIADRLLQAAVNHARIGGAKIVEAYPTDTLGGIKPPADMWRGTESQFLRAGFSVAARRRPARPIMRLQL